MLRMRITALALGVFFLTSKLGLEQVASTPHAGPLEGTWQITSVQRDGKPDETRVGTHLIFDMDEVRLQAPSEFGETNQLHRDFTDFDPTPVSTAALDREDARKSIQMSAVS